MMQPTGLDAIRAQAGVMTIGLMTVVSVGVVACIAIVITLCYLLVQFVLLMLRAIGEVFTEITFTWSTSDPFLRLLILAALVYGGYRLYQWRQAKRGGKP
jgi:hypothetical protein